MRYDVILWDVDNTLLDFDYSQRHSFCRCLREIGIEPEEEMVSAYAAINESWWKRLELGETTKEKLLVGRFQDFFAVYGIVCPNLQSFCGKYQEYLGSIYRYLDNSLEICRSLQSKCRQFAVTNGVTKTQSEKLRASGLAEIMEDIFISEQIGAPKPQKAFFDRVLERIGAPLEKILIVGDSLTSDIRGGRQAGIATCWYHPAGLPETETGFADAVPDHIIRHLKEVEGILEG